MASILKISDGTTTVDFINDSAYRILSWSPAVASRRQSELAGRGPYDEVVEEMTLFIGGSSALSKLATLQKLIEQANQWSRGEHLNVVYIHYKITGSSSEYIATIFGPPAPGEPAIILPPRFDDGPSLSAIEPIILRFKRAGLWLAATIDSASSSSVSNPTTATIGLTGTSNADSPYRLSLSNIPLSESVVWKSFVLATTADTTANAAKKLIVRNAETMAPGVGQPSSVSDTTHKARNGSVLRFSFSSAGSYDSALDNVSSVTLSTVRRWSVFVNVRNNSDTTSFTVELYGNNGGRYVSTGKKSVPADANNNKPYWMYLGQITLNQQLLKIFLSVAANAAGSLDIDSVVLLADDDPITSRAIAILQDETAAAGTTLTSPRQLFLYHGLDVDIKPSVYFIQGSNILYQEFAGDPVLFTRAAHPAIAAMWLACGWWNTSTWCATDDSGNVITNVFGAERMKGTLIVV